MSRVVSPKASELLARRLRAQIASGELRSGDVLPPESELMAALGVSRPTLREALRLLESEGLASVRRGNTGGVRIETADQAVMARYSSLHLAMAGATLGQVYAARDVLELEALRQVAEAWNPEQTATFTPLLAAEAVCGDDPEAFGMVHDRFHSELVRASENPVLDLLWHTLDEIVDRHRARFVGGRSGEEVVKANVRATREGRRAHQRLVWLLDQGRDEDAERAWTKHLASARSLLLSDDATGAVIDLLD